MLFYIETLGCQMNKLDSELVAGAMGRLDYQPTEDVTQADVAILNTCSVRDHAEQKALSRLGHFNHLRKKNGNPSVIAVMGCFAQRSPELIRSKAPFIDIICGPAELHELGKLISQSQAQRLAKEKTSAKIAVSDFRKIRSGKETVCEDLETLDMERPMESGEFQRFVRVQRGCDNFCSYCVVPFARGPECSRSVDHILEEVRRIDQTGCKEITLLGQAVSSYRWVSNGQTVGLAELLLRVHDACAIPRIRFITSYPANFSPAIFDAMAKLPRVCPYLHLPAQHGSNRMLGLMNRRYTIEQYLELLEQGRRIVPKLSIAGDFIVGFPTETQDDHQQSIELLKKVRYKNCFIFKYSIRPGTLAAGKYTPDQEIPEEIKSQRHSEMLAVQDQIAHEDNQAMREKVVEVLVEGTSKKNRANEQSTSQLVGRTVEDKIVIFNGPASLTGTIASVQIQSASSLTLFGELA
jgi:tRNA-2-methylthio-N6-dimethylallyladenosine synthase